MKYLFLVLLVSSCALAGGKKHSTPTPTPVPTATVAPSSSPSPSATATPVLSPTPSAWYKTANGVDLRACDSPIEYQNTPNCTAFSIVGSLANMVCDKQRLSEHHAWSLYEQYSVDAAAASVPGNKITTWDMWTESSRNPKAGYLDAAKHQITGMKYIDSNDDIGDVVKALDQGRPVYIGLAVPADMASCYAIIRQSSRITKGGHALEIVGYGKDDKVGGGLYFIIKQSWGTDCGDNGYMYMEASICNKSGMYCEFYTFDGFK